MAKTDMGHFPRLMNEQFGQILFTAVGVLDRIVLTGILLRIWGNATFEHWAVIVAYAGFGSLYEFGFSLYYNNRITFETERGDDAAAQATLGEANLVFAVCALLGVLTLSLFDVIFNFSGMRDVPGGTLATILVCSASSLRLLIIGPTAKYRANRAYSRFAYLSTLSELVRVLITGLAVVMGSNLLLTAAVSLSIQVMLPIALILWDSTKRYAPHHFAFRIPKGHSLREAMALSGAYFGQILPIILLGSIPVLFLQKQHVTAGTITAFVLIRTLANLARTPLQSLGVVIGQECGRRIALGESIGALAAVSSGARLFSVLSGLACGVVVFAGPSIVHLWTGSSAIFDLPLAIAAMLPMLIGPVSVLAHFVLCASNAPHLGLVGRWLQLALTIISFLIMASFDLTPGLNLMAALAAGELLGYLPFAYLGLNRLVPGLGFRFQTAHVLWTLMSAAIASASFYFSLSLANPMDTVQLASAFALGCVPCVMWAIVAAVDRETRHRIIVSVMQRFAVAV